MRRYYVGLDVHSKDSVYAIQDELGALIGEGSVPTTPEGLLGLRQRYGLPEGTSVGLETGTVAFYVARALQRIGLAPLVIDAHEVRIKAHRPTQKSDRRDAREICEGVRRGQYRSIVHVPPENITTLRDTLDRSVLGRRSVRLREARGKLCWPHSLDRSVWRSRRSRPHHPSWVHRATRHAVRGCTSCRTS